MVRRVGSSCNGLLALRCPVVDIYTAGESTKQSPSRIRAPVALRFNADRTSLMPDIRCSAVLKKTGMAMAARMPMMMRTARRSMRLKIFLLGLDALAQTCEHGCPPSPNRHEQSRLPREPLRRGKSSAGDGGCSDDLRGRPVGLKPPSAAHFSNIEVARVQGGEVRQPPNHRTPQTCWADEGSGSFGDGVRSSCWPGFAP